MGNQYTMGSLAVRYTKQTNTDFQPYSIFHLVRHFVLARERTFFLNRRVRVTRRTRAAVM